MHSPLKDQSAGEPRILELTLNWEPDIKNRNEQDSGEMWDNNYKNLCLWVVVKKIENNKSEYPEDWHNVTAWLHSPEGCLQGLTQQGCRHSDCPSVIFHSNRQNDGQIMFKKIHCSLTLM